MGFEIVEFKSLGGFAKTVSTFGWVIISLGVVAGCFLLGESFPPLVAVLSGVIISVLGFFIVISGQAISCMVAIARNTETTNKLLTRQTAE